MYHRTDVNMNKHMTKEEIAQAKAELAARNAETMKNGFEQKWCDPSFRTYYHPSGMTGRQIYTSYAAEELLDILIAVMEHHGHRPEWEKVHYVYKLYLTWRFGNLAQAKAKARARQKTLAQQAKWPSDWPQYVSSEPFYKWLSERGKTCTEADKANIEELCAQARRTGLPPDLSAEPCRRLGKFGDIKKCLEKMNIPPLRKNELRFMARYWRASINE